MAKKKVYGMRVSLMRISTER